jgi:hypothetical protein
VQQSIQLGLSPTFGGGTVNTQRRVSGERLFLFARLLSDRLSSPRLVGIRYQPVLVDVPWRLCVNPRRSDRHLSNRRATAWD